MEDDTAPIFDTLRRLEKETRQQRGISSPENEHKPPFERIGRVCQQICQALLAAISFPLIKDDLVEEEVGRLPDSRLTVGVGQTGLVVGALQELEMTVGPLQRKDEESFAAVAAAQLAKRRGTL